MLTVAEAAKMMNEQMPWWNLGTTEVFADRDYPPFHRVMMDGIAVSFAEYEKGIREFKLVGIARAGEVQTEFQSGAMEVMTGAPLPIGADLVIQYEHLEIKDGMAKIIVEVPRSQFESVHLMGSDCKHGDKVMEENLPWNGPHVGIAASMGAEIPDHSPKVMIISTGDELVEDDPLPHQIRRSNAYALKASLELFGYKNVTLSHLNDDPMEVATHYQQYAPLFDVMIYSGGVSKGKYDYLPNVWTEVGVTKYFHEVSQRPGKPLWFGKDETRKTVVLGLPGNPISSLVCLHRYFLKTDVIPVKLATPVTFKKKLTYFCPVKIEFKRGEIWAHPVKTQNSGEFTALMGTHGFVELPLEKDEFNTGEVFNFYSWKGGLC